MGRRGGPRMATARAGGDPCRHDVASTPVEGIRVERLTKRFGTVEALAGATLAVDPILLLDEPARNLDPVATASFREVLLGLTAERRATVLLATHGLHEAAALATRLVALDRGRVAFRSERGVTADELERQMRATAARVPHATDAA